MSPLRSSYLLSLLVLLSILVISSVSSPIEHPSPNENERFQELLANVQDSSAIHEALHSYSKFKDGCFDNDRTAVEAIRSENAPFATRMIKLAQRQVTNSSSSVVNPGTTSSSSVETSSSSAKTTTPTTTNSNIRTSVLAPTKPSEASAVSTTSGAVVFSSSGGGLTTISSSTALVSFSQSTAIVESTTTLPGGQRSTLTYTSIVDAPVSTLPPTALAASTTSTSAPSLQTGGAGRPRDQMCGAMAVAGGVLVLGWMI